MRVGVVYPVPLYPDGSGYTSDSQTFNSIAAWTRGFERADLVTFVASGTTRRGHFAVGLGGMRLLPLPCPTTRIDQYVTGMPAILRRLQEILRAHRHEWDAVILFDLIFPNWSAYYMCRALGIPVAVRMVGRYDLFVRESLQREGLAKAAAGLAYSAIIRKTARWAAERGVVVTDGDAGFAPRGAESAVRFCVESHLDAASIPSANPYDASSGDDAFRILSVSRIHPAKGVHLLIEAASALVLRDPRVELDIIGPHYGSRYGNYKATVDESIRRVGGDRVRYHGMVEDGPEFERLWRRASVFAVPYTSNADGVPRVIFEAMARGIPVVATAIGGISNVVRDGVEGLVVRPGDVTALSDAMERLRVDPELRGRLSRASFAAIGMYTSQAVSKLLPAMLAEALCGTAATRAPHARDPGGRDAP